MTLHQLIVTAHSVREFQVVGGPDWIKDHRFDVIGKIPEDAPENPSRPMLKTLLAQRFKLVTHDEMREQPVYELRLARADGNPGPGLTRVQCDDHPCGNTDTNESSAGGVVTGRGLTMEELARWASSRVDRLVVDRTGLAGAYDFEMKYARDVVRSAGSPQADLPTLYTALQEQLGLKLEGGRAPVSSIVVDRAERPTPD